VVQTEAAPAAEVVPTEVVQTEAAPAAEVVPTEVVQTEAAPAAVEEKTQPEDAGGADDEPSSEMEEEYVPEAEEKATAIGEQPLHQESVNVDWFIKDKNLVGWNRYMARQEAPRALEAAWRGEEEGTAADDSGAEEMDTEKPDRDPAAASSAGVSLRAQLKATKRRDEKKRECK
jgi:hypothetical protein